MLPFWARPFSRLVFLSWTADLLRSSLSPTPVPDIALRLAVIVGLGLAAFVGGTALLRRVLDRVPRDDHLRMTTFDILRHAAIAGFQDLRSLYTWKPWSTGWLLRVIMQVIFYSLLGRLIGSQDQVHFLVVGNAGCCAPPR